MLERKTRVTSPTKHKFTATFALETLIKNKASDRNSIFSKSCYFWLSSWERDVSYGKDFRRITRSTNFEWPLSFRKLTITLITGKEEDCLIFCFLQYVFQGASLYQRLPLCCRYSCVVSRVLVWVTICMKQVSRNVARKIHLSHARERVLRCHLTTLYSYVPHLRTLNKVSVGSLYLVTRIVSYASRSSKFKVFYPSGRSCVEISLVSLERSILF